MKIKKENLVTPKKSKTSKEIHEKWAKENGYQENDTLNSKNSTCFKDGTER